MTVLWPHTKTLVPIEAGYEFIDEMLTPPIAKHTVAFTNNSVFCIITPPLFGKLLVGAEPAAARQELRLLDNLKATDA